LAAKLVRHGGERVLLTGLLFGPGAAEPVGQLTDRALRAGFGGQPGFVVVAVVAFVAGYQVGGDVGAGARA
jgi:hypothetical protein